MTLKKKKASEQVTEAFDFELMEGSVTEESEESSGLVRGVKLLGLKSANGRDYDTHGVRSTAVEHLTRARVFVNHPRQATDPRRYEDQIGTVESARYVAGKGYYGDIRFNPKHRLFQQLSWDIRNNARALGMSINASLRVSRQRDREGRLVIEGIHSVRSVDLVTHPATTNGVFEHEETPVAGLTTEELLEQLRNNPDALEQLRAEGESANQLTEVQTALEAAQQEIEALKSEKAAAERLASVTEQVDGLLADTPLRDLSVQVVEHLVSVPAEHAGPVVSLLESVLKAVKELPLSRQDPQLGKRGRSGDPKSVKEAWKQAPDRV